MAKVTMRLDDVLLALKKGKRVVAEEKVSLSIPGSMSETGRRRNLKLDVSDDGQKLLDEKIAEKDSAIEKAKEDYDKAIESAKDEFEKAEKKAWSTLNKIADHKSPAKKPDESSQEENSDTEQDSEQHQAEEQSHHNQESAFGPSANNHQRTWS